MGIGQDERVQMWCSACRQADTAPRHHVLAADGSLVSKHMDCCRDSGCPDASCDAILRDSGEKRDDGLLAWIRENR